MNLVNDFNDRMTAAMDMIQEAHAAGVRITRDGLGFVKLMHGTSENNGQAIRDGRALDSGSWLASSQSSIRSHVGHKHKDLDILTLSIDPRDVSFSSATGEFYIDGALWQGEDGRWRSPARDFEAFGGPVLLQSAALVMQMPDISGWIVKSEAQTWSFKEDEQRIAESLTLAIRNGQSHDMIQTSSCTMSNA